MLTLHLLANSLLLTDDDLEHCQAGTLPPCSVGNRMGLHVPSAYCREERSGCAIQAYIQ